VGQIAPGQGAPEAGDAAAGGSSGPRRRSGWLLAAHQGRTLPGAGACCQDGARAPGRAKRITGPLLTPAGRPAPAHRRRRDCQRSKQQVASGFQGGPQRLASGSERQGRCRQSPGAAPASDAGFVTRRAGPPARAGQPTTAAVHHMGQGDWPARAASGVARRRCTGRLQGSAPGPRAPPGLGQAGQQYPGAGGGQGRAADRKPAGRKTGAQRRAGAKAGGSDSSPSRGRLTAAQRLRPAAAR